MPHHRVAQEPADVNVIPARHDPRDQSVTGKGIVRKQAQDLVEYECCSRRCGSVIAEVAVRRPIPSFFEGNTGNVDSPQYTKYAGEMSTIGKPRRRDLVGLDAAARRSEYRQTTVQEPWGATAVTKYRPAIDNRFPKPKPLWPPR